MTHRAQPYYAEQIIITVLAQLYNISLLTVSIRVRNDAEFLSLWCAYYSTSLSDSNPPLMAPSEKLRFEPLSRD